MRVRAFFFVFGFVVFTAAAQQLPVESYTPANGLVDARVTKMFQDTKGLIYFLTREGFSIFDGQRFDNYANTGEGTNIINDITEYQDGTVKLFGFDGEQYIIKRNKVTKDTSQKKILSEVNNVFSLDNGDKIIVTNSALLYEQANQIRKLSIPFSNFQNFSVAKCLASKNLLIVSVKDKKNISSIYLYNYKDRRIVDSIFNYELIQSVTDKNGRIFLLSSKWQQLDSAELEKGKLVLMDAWFNKLIPVGHRSSWLYFDKEDNSFLINEQGLIFRINEQDRKGEFFMPNLQLGANANFIFEDIEKNYWVVSYGNAVNKIQPSFLSRIKEIDKVKLNAVLNFNKDDRGNVFLQTTNKMFLANKNLGTIKIPQNGKGFYWQNAFWYFKDFKTLASSNGRVFNIEKYLPNYTSIDFVPSTSTIDQAGRLIISGAQMFVISPNYTFKAIQLPYYADNIIVDNQNNYWAFCRNNDVVKYSWYKDELVIKFKKNITNLNPRCALFLDDNTIVCGTRRGGLRFLSIRDNDVKVVASIDKGNGLSNNFIYALHQKSKNELLVGTGTGLDIIRFLKSDTIIENVTVRNNIFSTFTGFIKNNDSSIFCTTSTGQLYSLQKADGLNSNFNPTIFFRKILADDKEIIDEHRFNYTVSNFFFSVSAPTFFDNKKVTYQFVLKAKNKQWQQAGNNPDYSINNLLAGDYILTVTVQYPGKIYPDKKMSYHFKIDKPYWLQWWFILITILGIIGIFILFIRLYYLRQLEKQKLVLEKQQAIEKERTRIATDMHDDLGSGLTKITYLSQMALSKESNKEDLQSIKKTSTELVENMSEIIWAMKEDNNTIEDLVSYVKTYAQEYCTDNNLNCIIQLPEKLYARSVSGQNRRNIYLAIKESLHNIVKHANARNVWITASFSNQWKLSIKDDGIGFNPSPREKHIGGNGLRNIYKRIEAVNGNVEIVIDNGTEIIFYIPL